jgi:polygalacturonase
MNRNLRPALILLAAGFLLVAADGRGRDFQIDSYGAKGDGIAVNTRFIQSAIDECAGAGGGRVVVPPGVFVTGALRLASRVEFHLESGAVLRGSGDLADYRLDGKRVGMLFTQGAEDVSITGLGTIDGNDAAFFEWDRAKSIPAEASRLTRQKEAFRRVASGIGDGPVVPKDRPFQTVIFSQCRDVRLRDVTIAHAPFWTLHIADCDNVTVSGVFIDDGLTVPNADGIDVTSSRDVLISGSNIRSGDDCIVVGGYSRHYDLPGFSGLRRPAENVCVTNCNLQTRSCAIRIGGADQNDMRNCHFSNLTIIGSNRGIGVFLRDEGSIEDMTFSDISIDTRLHTGDWWGQGEPIHLSAVRGKEGVKLGRIRNLCFSNILCRGESGIVVLGTEESVIRNVTFDGVTLSLSGGPLAASAGGNIDLRPVLDEKLALFSSDIPGLLGRWVEDLSISDFRVDWGPDCPAFFTHGIEVGKFRGLRIRDFEGSGASGRSDVFPIFLHDGEDARVDGPAGRVRMERVVEGDPTRY